MSRGKNSRSYEWRHWFVITIFVVMVLGLVARMVQLMIVDRAFLLDQGDARALRTVSIPSYRGIIADRNGEPLAISTPVSSVWVNPREINVKDKRIMKLARLLKVSARSIRKKLRARRDREFVYLKRRINPSLAAQIKALKIRGLFLQREYRRFYPEGEVMAHIIGMTNIDDSGQEGLELAYNDWLRGVPGKKRVVKDRLGRIVEDLNLIQTPKPGHDLVLSLDRRIQYLAYRELKQAVNKFKAKSGSVVVLNVHTGEILAMANQPSFNPNNRRHGGRRDRFRNRAVTDTFEPGSVLKAMTVVNALASGHYKADTLIDTAPITLDGHRVADPHRHGVISVAKILQISSNVGVTKLTLGLPPDSLYKMLHRFGFGERTQSGFPGESAGKLKDAVKWKPFALATLSFGYGISVTPLQLARAYAILGAGGVQYPITFLRTDKAKHKTRVVTKKVSRSVLLMLEKVIARGGTAPLARVPGYRVTGKTGTTRIVGKHGYERFRHNSIFVGVAPASHPSLVVAVVIHEPGGKIYYGGSVAAPVFSKVMGGALRMLNIAPDNIKKAA